MLLLALKVWVPQHDTSPLTPSVCIIFKLIWKRVLPDIASEALSVFVSVFIYLGLRLKTLEGATCFWVYWHIADQGLTIRLVRKGKNQRLQDLVKNPKIRKFKLCLLFGLNVFLYVLTFIQINYQCSKLNTYLVIPFLSEWGYSVYIEIPLRLSPAKHSEPLKKYERSDVTFSYAHLWKENDLIN